MPEGARLPHVHKEKQKTPSHALDAGGKGPKSGNKSGHEEVGLEEGSAML